MRYTCRMDHAGGAQREAVSVGVVLAGGEARRMGRDKRLLRLAGATLVARNVALLKSIFPTVAVSLRDPRQLGENLPAGVELLVDQLPNCPLGGIGTSLAHFGAPVFMLAGDTAFAGQPAVERVLAAFSGADVTLPVVDGHLEPLHAVYGPGCIAPIEQLLADGRLSILDLLPLVRVAEVEFHSTRPFFNVNTPQDWREAQRRLGAAATRPAVLGVIGRSNSGKTTLIEKLIPELIALGLKVGAVKSVPDFDIDMPGKDSWRHGRSGAAAYAVASSSKLAYVATLPAELPLADIAARYFAGFDVVVCEGYRHEAPQVVEVFRRGAGYDEPLCPPAESLALVSDADIAHAQRFGLDEAQRLAHFVAERLGLLREPS